MMPATTALLAAGVLVLASAPGEAPPSYDDVPAIAKAAIARRIGTASVDLQSLQVKPSDSMPGFVACGIAIEGASATQRARKERFFVVVPGSFAILERDGKDLIDHYWSLNRCS
jgi:hypothetical protein